MTLTANTLVVGSFDCNDGVNTRLTEVGPIGMAERAADQLGGPGVDVAIVGALDRSALVQSRFMVEIEGADLNDLLARVNELRKQIPGCDAAPETQVVTLGLIGMSAAQTMLAKTSPGVDLSVTPQLLSYTVAKVELLLTHDPYVFGATELLYADADVDLPTLISLAGQTGIHRAPLDWDIISTNVNRMVMAVVPQGVVLSDLIRKASDQDWSGGAWYTDAATYPDGSANQLRGTNLADGIYCDVDVSDMEPAEYAVWLRDKATTAGEATAWTTYTPPVPITTTELGLHFLGIVTLPTGLVRGGAPSLLRVSIAGDGGTNYAYANTICFAPVSRGGYMAYSPEDWCTELLCSAGDIFADDVFAGTDVVGSRALMSLRDKLLVLGLGVVPAPKLRANVTVSALPRWDQLLSTPYVPSGGVLSLPSMDTM